MGRPMLNAFVNTNLNSEPILNSTWVDLRLIFCLILLLNTAPNNGSFTLHLHTRYLNRQMLQTF